MVLSENYFATRGVGVSPVDLCPNNGFNFAAYRYCSRSKQLIDVLGNIPKEVYGVQPIDRIRVKDKKDNKYIYILQGIVEQMRKELEDDNIMLDDEQSVDGNKILSTLYLLSSLCYIVTKSEHTGYDSVLATKNEAILNMVMSNTRNMFLHLTELKKYAELSACCTVTLEELQTNTLNIVTLSQDPYNRIAFCNKGSLAMKDIDGYCIVPYYMMRLRFLDVLARIGNEMSVISYIRDGREEQVQTMFNNPDFMKNTLNKAKYDCSKIVVRDFATDLDEEIGLLEITDIQPFSVFTHNCGISADTLNFG